MRRRRGFTLLELTISITLLLLIMGASVQFLRRQAAAVALESQRLEALQNAQYAATQIERELREAGAGVADAQPMLVQLDSLAFTFNANLLSAEPGDVRAVYRSVDADPAAVRAMYPAEAQFLPNSRPPRAYPDSTYYASRGVPSGAETISYYLVSDGTATTGSTYALWRRVNATAATLVARNLVRNRADSIPVFTYFTQNSLGALVPVSPASLPAYHVPLHGSPADTGRSAITDNIRVVRVHLVALAVDPRAGADSIKYRVVETRVRLLNAGLLQLSACGARPVAVLAPTVTQSTTGAHAVTLAWTRAADDGAGEKDIERYAVFRRPAAGSQMGEPIASIPAVAGATTYSFTDVGVVAGASYVYGVAAQDCTPTLSDIATSSSLTISP